MVHSMKKKLATKFLVWIGGGGGGRERGRTINIMFRLAESDLVIY